MENLRPLIEARIRAQVTDFKEVAGASDLQNITANRLSDPGCYVFEESVKIMANRTINSVTHMVTLQFAIVIVLKNVKDARGSDAADVSHGLQNSIRLALLGWKPHSTTDQMEYSGGVLVSFANGFFIWRDSYTTNQLINS
jgi:hypothetical protein